MSNEVEPPTRKKVAVVGSGCSGIASLWALKGTGHEVYLYEADGRLGGHSNTVQWRAGKYTVGVDTGFIVLNTATYPNFINFLKNLNIATELTDMALGVSRDHGAFEWGGKSLSSVFAQPRNIFSPKMWRMLFDVIRFNQFALDVLIDADKKNQVHGSDVDNSVPEGETIGEYLDQHGYSDAFRDGYLIPITASVSVSGHPYYSSCLGVSDAAFILARWNHHNLSTISSRPAWLTLKEGSRSYIEVVMKDFPSERVFLNSSVQRVDNDASGRVVLSLDDGRQDTFDHVILATHGDQALSILGPSATEEERSILSCFKTSQNEVVLHSDLKHMPQRRKAWSSWNYMTLSPQAEGYTDIVSLTYNMNTLQHIPEDKFGHVLVTLNPLLPPDPALTQGRFQYSHPLYTPKAVQAQKRLRNIQNKRGISYIGAWTKYGFHEDGFTSGLQAAQEYLGAKLPFDIVDPSLGRGARPRLTLADYFARLLIILIQVLVIRPLELLAGTSRQPVGKRRLKEVKQT